MGPMYMYLDLGCKPLASIAVSNVCLPMSSRRNTCADIS
jgi:hypothetical protein